MKLGVCTGPEQWNTAAEAGFDFIECPLNKLAAMTEEAYQELLKASGSAPIPLYAFNCLLPGDLKVTGPSADEAEQRRYLDLAFSRAHALGASVVVFGSGASRQVPEGFPHEKAWQQIISFLRTAAAYGEKYSLDIAIEPLRRSECNILNFVSEAVLLASVVRHPRIRVLGDTFHMVSGYEPWDALTRAGTLLRHIHISHPLPECRGRDFPSPEDGSQYAEIIRTLKEMHYEGHISIEAGTDQLLADGRKAVAALRKDM